MVLIRPHLLLPPSLVDGVPVVLLGVEGGVKGVEGVPGHIDPNVEALSVPKMGST